MSECDREASIMRRPWHTGGRCAIRKNSPVVSGKGCEADHSPLPSAETKNAWN